MDSPTNPTPIDLDLRQLEVFCAVVRCGSFRAAAREVQLAQSTVSERIAALEEEVGTRLLERSRRRGVTPTPVGGILYRRALSLLREREQAVREIRHAMGAPGGTLRLGASTTPAAHYLPPLLADFRRDNPGVRFSIAVGNSEAVLDWVADGIVEMGIAGDLGERVIEDLVRRRSRLELDARLWEDQLVVAVPAGHPWAGRDAIAAAELAGAPLVIREAGSGTRRWLEVMLEEALPGGLGELEIAAELGSASSITRAVIEGLGIAVVSQAAVAREVDAGLVSTARLAPPLARRFYLIRGPRSASPLCRRFAAALRSSRSAIDAIAGAD